MSNEDKTYENEIKIEQEKFIKNQNKSSTFTDPHLFLNHLRDL